MSDAADLENLKHEIALQSLSVHENIVRYIETYLHQRRLWVRTVCAARRALSLTHRTDCARVRAWRPFD